MTLTFHSYANLFPLIEGQEFYDLAEDIRINGLREQIGLVEVDGTSQILDGRNRYRSLVWIVTNGQPLGEGWGVHAGRLLTAGDLTCQDQPWRAWLYLDGDADDYGDDLLGYVLSKNLNRRHLTDDQRRMLGARLVNMRPGRQPSQIANISREQAAELVTADVAGIDRARAVVAHAAPEVVAAVDEGALSVAAAAEIAAQPAERQAEIVQVLTEALRHQLGDDRGKLTQQTKKALAPLIREIRVEKIAAKKERRAEREAETGRKIQALPGNFYGVAIEDFEWHHAAWSEETGSEKSPSMHYETAVDAQSPEAIVARCADRFACLAEDCVLFKWTTVPHLAIAIRVLELQGFRYVTSLVWNKERSGAARGPGYWFTGEHEIVLVGVRGKVIAPATAHFRSNFSAPVGGHSEKPDNLHAIVEFHWPTTPKVEFNARRVRPGWAAWGFDAPATDGLFGDQVAAKRARSVYPAGHTVTMTNPVIDGAMRSIGRCACGEVFSFAWGDHHSEMDAAIEAHWQIFDAQPEKTDGRGNAVEQDKSFAAGVPSDAGETVAAAADAIDGASPVAAVTDIPSFLPAAAPAFPPNELAELQAFMSRAPAEQLAPIAPAYEVRGLVQEWLGEWRITRAGQVRIDVLMRERAEREALFRGRLEQQDFWDWRDLAAIAAGEHIDNASARSLIGLDLAAVNDEAVSLTDAGRARLAELEVIVEGAPAPAPSSTPYQLDLVQMLEGAK